VSRFGPRRKLRNPPSVRHVPSLDPYICFDLLFYCREEIKLINSFRVVAPFADNTL
jgi:hypothetical protein